MAKKMMSFRFSDEDRANLEYLMSKWSTDRTDVLVRLLREAIEETKELRLISKERREEIERGISKGRREEIERDF